MLKVEALLVSNCVMAISEALREIEVGGMTVGKVRGRGKHKPAKLHAAKGSELFQPQFSDRYIITIIIPESKEDAVINILKTKGTGGKVFVSTISRAIDITSGLEGEKNNLTQILGNYLLTQIIVRVGCFSTLPGLILLQFMPFTIFSPTFTPD